MDSVQPKHRRCGQLAILALSVLLLAGCDNWGPPKKSKDIPDDELREKWRDCQGLKQASPMQAMACDNYERECKRRRKADDIVCY